ncbi:hypothetical protein MGG_10575 [Pyricularia oryzae 70-15]|uniref:BHLH domain-containing protein n=4 Tax=Pyricularia TaxID=48558 RepID=G5EH94_PYRO7|nr:uncharacterized protein MGG_10575 [Pyricularia oryzae 70-15]AAX07706.1 serine-rich protein-like protein [Pyricularia grisea]ELQ40863.1 hypothetical protein OOU_Y34scaffold00334g33 [Pyricularia oryzae Y34]KAI7913700.1 hypothetical protein M0657_009882 [Pyricularia oryzae]EAQ70717.1 hypothetical protein MGCH7_ch7g124 [Pyricularia oryzae 70-15]EHA46632.1 hypothetical protein MGG_10575 [Pyricularia oryzae 70-15]
MSGMLVKDSTIPFDPFSTAYLVRDQQDYDYSPSALFTPLDCFPTDFNSESLASPTLENNNDWTSFDSLSSPDIFKTDSFDDSPILTSIPSASPSIDPMDLAAPAMPDDNVPFGDSAAFPETITGPLFPSPQLARVQNPPPINHHASRPELSVSTRRGTKRKSTGSSSTYSASPSPRSSASPPPRPAPHLPPKKTAHNMIEKRYRNNLNDKISALRDAVPALRVMVHRLEAHASPDDSANSRCALSPQEFEEDLGGLTPAHKLNKATILSKATEYINHLERKNRALARENHGLRGKVDGLEMLVMNGAVAVQGVQQQHQQQWC